MMAKKRKGQPRRWYKAKGSVGDLKTLLNSSYINNVRSESYFNKIRYCQGFNGMVVPGARLICSPLK